MTDEQQQEQQQPEGTPSATEGAPKEPDWKAEAEKWKAMSRKHEGQAKQNADAAKRLAELEDANKSETQKLADKAAAAEKRAADAEAKAARYEVASRLGIRANHLKYLSGSTPRPTRTPASRHGRKSGSVPVRPPQRNRTRRTRASWRQRCRVCNYGVRSHG